LATAEKVAGSQAGAGARSRGLHRTRSFSAEGRRLYADGSLLVTLGRAPEGVAREAAALLSELAPLARAARGPKPAPDPFAPWKAALLPALKKAAGGSVDVQERWSGRFQEYGLFRNCCPGVVAHEDALFMAGDATNGGLLATREHLYHGRARMLWNRPETAGIERIPSASLEPVGSGEGLVTFGPGLSCELDGMKASGTACVAACLRILAAAAEPPARPEGPPDLGLYAESRPAAREALARIAYCDRYPYGAMLAPRIRPQASDWSRRLFAGSGAAYEDVLAVFGLGDWHILLARDGLRHGRLSGGLLPKISMEEAARARAEDGAFVCGGRSWRPRQIFLRPEVTPGLWELAGFHNRESAVVGDAYFLSAAAAAVSYLAANAEEIFACPGPAYAGCVPALDGS
jgi:hypothetical protein